MNSWDAAVAAATNYYGQAEQYRRAQDHALARARLLLAPATAQLHDVLRQVAETLAAHGVPSMWAVRDNVALGPGWTLIPHQAWMDGLFVRADQPILHVFGAANPRTAAPLTAHNGMVNVGEAVRQVHRLPAGTVTVQYVENCRDWSEITDVISVYDPSHREGGSMSLITSNATGSRDHIHVDENGVLVMVRDYDVRKSDLVGMLAGAAGQLIAQSK